MRGWVEIYVHFLVLQHRYPNLVNYRRLSVAMAIYPLKRMENNLLLTATFERDAVVTYALRISVVDQRCDVVATSGNGRYYSKKFSCDVTKSSVGRQRILLALLWDKAITHRFFTLPFPRACNCL